MTHSLFMRVNTEELKEVESLITSGGFSTRQAFLRACVNAYAGREILKPKEEHKRRKPEPPKPRPRPKKIKPLGGGWTFDGGLVITSAGFIHVHFENPPDVETYLKLRFMHFVPLNDRYEWKADQNLRTLKEIFNLYPEKD